MVKLLKRAPPAAKKMLSSHDLAIELSSNEGMAESRMVVAQHLWGEANLAPSDSLFASSAIAALLVNSSSAFAVVAPRLFGRLTRLAEETRIWVDVFETEPVRFSLDRRKVATIRRTPWTDARGLIPKNKFTTIFVAQPTHVTQSLATLYADCRLGLKAGGDLYVADLISVTSPAAPLMPDVTVPGCENLMSVEVHRRAFAEAKLTIQQEYDLTRDLMMAIRDGFLKGVGRLADIRQLRQPWRNQRLAGFLVELDVWFKLYCLLERGHVTARGFLVGPG
jgi:hypothetical protein